jgi:acyl-CoA thioesterase
VSDHVTPLESQTLLEHYRRVIAEQSFPFPYAARLGFRLVAVEPGHAVVELDCNEAHWNTTSTVHGGVYCSVADTAMGIAHGSLVGTKEITTTVDIQTYFLRPFKSGLMRAEATVVRHGRTLSLVECDVRDADGILLARASSNCMTVRRADRKADQA